MIRALVALSALLLLTLLLGLLDERQGSAAGVAAIAMLKAGIIGVVFLELDHAHPIWGVAAALLVGGVLAGATVLMGA